MASRSRGSAHKEVEITVVVLISQGHALGGAARIKSPCGPHFLEGQITAIAKRHFGNVQRWEVLGNLNHVLERESSSSSLRSLDGGRKIGVSQIALLPCGHEQILIPVEIDVQKHATPRPILAKGSLRIGRRGILVT